MSDLKSEFKSMRLSEYVSGPTDPIKLREPRESFMDRIDPWVHHTENLDEYTELRN